MSNSTKNFKGLGLSMVIIVMLMVVAPAAIVLAF
jgi:hypothetical protein